MTGQHAESGHSGPPAEPPWDFAGLFLVERARLSELLASLGPADWDRPSPCPGWTVLGLSSHLVGDDLGFLARHRDGHFGTPGPDDASESEFVAWLDGLQDEWVRAARRLSPRIVADLLEWAGPQVAETMRGEDPRARTAGVSWAGTEPVPAWLNHARELSEYWIHRQQLLQAVGRPSDLRADLAGPVLDGLRWAYPFRLGQAAAQPGDSVTISVTGPVTVDLAPGRHAGRLGVPRRAGDAGRREPGDDHRAGLAAADQQPARRRPVQHRRIRRRDGAQHPAADPGHHRHAQASAAEASRGADIKKLSVSCREQPAGLRKGGFLDRSAGRAS